MFQTDNSIAVMVDIQEKLVSVMHESERLITQSLRLIKGLAALDVPILCTEQLPDKLGPSVTDLSAALPDYAPITKSTFSCCGESKFMEALAAHGRTNIILFGIETHVCVFQTAAQLIEQGCSVQVIGDCTSSRTPANVETGLNRVMYQGVDVSSVESTLFELMGDATHPSFKAVLSAVK
jgi:nicotinamidase-related amidase